MAAETAREHRVPGRTGAGRINRGDRREPADREDPKGLPIAVRALGAVRDRPAAQAIMTTDPFPKEAAARISIDGRSVDGRRMAQGSGMIEPMMATMLAFVTTDAAVAQACCLDRALRDVVDDTFNANYRRRRVLDQRHGDAPGERRQRHHDLDQTNLRGVHDALRAVCLRLALGIVRGAKERPS